MAADYKTIVKDLRATVGKLKSDRIGYSRSLTNLQNRTRALLDHLDEYVQPKLKGHGVANLRAHVDNVRRLLP